MYGDATVVRALAHQMRDQAAEIRAESAALAVRAAEVPWTGVAADTLRLTAREHAAALNACARAHDHAADLLEQHAREVDHTKALIAAAEHRINAAIESLGRGASALVRSRAAHWLAHVDLPSPGHLGWLETRLPRWLP